MAGDFLRIAGSRTEPASRTFGMEVGGQASVQTPSTLTRLTPAGTSDNTRMNTARSLLLAST